MCRKDDVFSKMFVLTFLGNELVPSPHNANFGQHVRTLLLSYNSLRVGECTCTRVRVTNWENICSSKIYALKALNCLNKRLNSSNKPRKYTN